MKRCQSQYSRMLKLDELIRNGKYPNCLTFAKKWEVTTKTIWRDIEFMKWTLGAPLAFDRNKKGYYYTDLHWFLPALSLSEGELFMLLITSRAMEQYQGTPVAAKLQLIFRKIAELLPEKMSVPPELMLSRFSFTAPPAKPINENIWITVVRGLLSQRHLRITYRGFESATTHSFRLAPYHLANLQGEWYVFGTADNDAQVKQYSMARIQRAILNETHFDIPPDFNPQKLLSQTFGRFVLGEQQYPVKLLFQKDVAEWVMERQWHPKQKIIIRKNGDIELSFEAGGLLEVQRWVLAWGHYVKVLEPAELKQMVSAEIKQMNQLI